MTFPSMKLGSFHINDGVKVVQAGFIYILKFYFFKQNAYPA